MEIADIKQQLGLAQVLDHYHLKPDKHGMLHCPFHDDKTPSLQVYYKTQSCYCFSANCSTHGKSLDVIDFIMFMESRSSASGHMDKSTKHEAIKKAELLLRPDKAQPSSGTESMITGTNADAPSGRSARVRELSRADLLTRMFTYFRNGVHNSKPAKEYLESRNLNKDKLQVGYNSGQFHHGNRKEKHLVESCLKYGLLLDRGHVNNRTGEKAYSPFGKNCIVFALRNPQNQVVSLYFRSTIDNHKARHFYLKDRQGLYPNHPKPETKKLILTESIIDAATLQQLELQDYELLALCGTNGLTEEHAKAIGDLQELEEIIFFLNGDEAGRKATEKYSKELQQLKPTTKITEVEVPKNEDINSLAQSHEAEIFTHLLDNRKPFFTSNEKEEKPKPTTPKPPAPESKCILDTENPEQITFENEWLTATVWGGIEKENLSRLKVSLHIKSKENKYKTFRDDVNLYSHQSTKKLVQNLTEALELSTTLVSNTVTELTEKLEEYRMKEREAQVKALKPKLYEMTDKEEQQAMKFLKSPELVKKTLSLISQSGLIGEQKNGLLLFFLYLSRFFDEPLHAIIFGRSGSGKTYLQTKI
ncbi:toprim domain-containing protein, partial [Fulvivirga imtechensis]|uniref:toprim domain-containing protein n=1 Tax=Fulvivirga imtechensis TaxID=881893 RepID=UPI00161F1A7C